MYNFFGICFDNPLLPFIFSLQYSNKITMYIFTCSYDKSDHRESKTRIQQQQLPKNK